MKTTKERGDKKHDKEGNREENQRPRKETGTNHRLKESNLPEGNDQPLQQGNRQERTTQMVRKEMDMRFYINGEKTTKKSIEELIGKDSLEAKIKEAQETFLEDPYIENSWFLGSKGMLTIEIEAR